jgi:hypothetical protein
MIAAMNPITKAKSIIHLLRGAILSKEYNIFPKTKNSLCNKNTTFVANSIFMLSTALQDLKNKIRSVVFDCLSGIDTVELDTKLYEFPTSPGAYAAADMSPLENLSEEERTIALLALVKNIQPEILNIFTTIQYVFPNVSFIGGKLSKEPLQYAPTVFTALFIICGKQTDKRVELISRYLHPEAPLFKRGILKSLENDPLLGDSDLECTPEFIYRITTGQQYIYQFTAAFPASPVIPKQSWDDLILPHSVRSKVDELIASIKYHEQIINDPEMGRRFKQNILALFSGDPGTGKTLTAGLLGQELQMPVYRIDLSRIVSKWVGETTKNLRNLFDVAENKKWILFFDEADSIFGKRSKGSGEANDHYHNQDISYLLQRIDNYKGFVILATNLGINIDEAFRRRIDLEITFMHPDKDTRVELWRKAFQDARITFTERPPKKLRRLEMNAGNWETVDEGVSLEELAEYWERATGAKVNKVMKRLMIECLEKNTRHLPSGVIVQALQAELGLRKM